VFASLSRDLPGIGKVIPLATEHEDGVRVLVGVLLLFDCERLDVLSQLDLTSLAGVLTADGETEVI
jgi:hypothetical protein